MKIFDIFLLAILIFIGSCKDNSTQQPIPQKLDSLAGTAWKWEKFKDENGKIISVFDSTFQIFIMYFQTDTNAKGIAGCNEFSFSFRRKNDTIYALNGFTTSVWCTFTDIFERSLWDTCNIISANENELILGSKKKSCSIMYFSRNVSKPIFHPGEVHDIDINQDSIIDFRFSYDDVINSDTIIGYNLNIHTLNENMSTYGMGGCLDENHIIDDKIHFKSGNLQISGISKYYFGWYDYWFLPTDKKYLPIKFKLNDGYHFGWILISVSRTNGNLTIHDFDYNKIPDKAILAGEK